MFGVALDRVQGLFSREFLTAAFAPWLIFAVLNLAMVEFAWPAPVRPISVFLDADPAKQAIYLVTGLATVTVVAFAGSPLQALLRMVLEGRWLPSSIAGSFRQHERDREKALTQRLETLAGLTFGLAEAVDADKRSLGEARRKGKGTRLSDPAALARARRAIRALWGDGELPKLREEAVVSTSLCLRFNDVSQSADADALHLELIAALDRLETRAEKALVRLHDERAIYFPGDELAPTRMGNIAGAVHSYAEVRYGISLEFFWPRLRFALGEQKSLLDAIATAESRLNFLLLLVFQMSFFALFWSIELVVVAGYPLLFLAVAVGAPVAARTAYLLACEAYVHYGDLLRTALDLHRFQMLRAFRLRLPSSNEYEIKLWHRLRRALAQGEREHVAYDHQAPQ